MENSNQPAFPVTGGTVEQNGLSKREYIAAMAMQGLLAAGKGVDMEDGSNKASTEPEDVAVTAIEYADALLKQLETSKP